VRRRFREIAKVHQLYPAPTSTDPKIVG